MIESGLNFYKKNSIRALQNWNILSDATIVQVGEDYNIEIDEEGYAGTVLSSDYNNGLSASMYRLLYIKVYLTVNQDMDYQNLVDVVLRITYVTNSAEKVYSYISVNLTTVGNTLGTDAQGDYISMTRLIEMENYSIEDMTLIVRNNSGAQITLADLTLRRSQDISSNQVGDSIGWGIALRQADKYLDGWKLYYDGVEEPDRLYFMADENEEFIGINVNNERMIAFNRVNETLDE